MPRNQYTKGGEATSRISQSRPATWTRSSVCCARWASTTASSPIRTEPAACTSTRATAPIVDNNTPNEPTLVDTPATLANYDMVLFPCLGRPAQQDPRRAAGRDRIRERRRPRVRDALQLRWLAGRVGSVMTRRRHPHGRGAGPQPAPWVGNLPRSTSTTAPFRRPRSRGSIDQSFPQGRAALATWLAQPAVNTSTTAGQIGRDQRERFVGDVDSVECERRRSAGGSAPPRRSPGPCTTRSTRRSPRRAWPRGSAAASSSATSTSRTLDHGLDVPERVRAAR